MEAIRQAAFAGLVALDALHIQRALPEAERKWPIGHHAFVLDGNRKLFAYIARRWERIGQDGSSPLSVFGAEDGEHWMIWDRLAPYIRGSEACRMAFLDYCAGESKPISGAALEALAREMPGSELLKAQCFRHVAASRRMSIPRRLRIGGDSSSLGDLSDSISALTPKCPNE